MRYSRKAWRDMADAVTSADVRVMLETGNIPIGLQATWQEIYADYVNTKLLPRWEAAAQAGASNVRSTVATLPREAVAAAVRERAGQLITSLTNNQRSAVQGLLRYHIATNPLGQSELAKLIRPAVGALPRDVQMITAQREELLAKGVPRERVNNIVARRLGRAQARRAETIARTELASAYNFGTQIAVENASAQGAFDAPVMKEWVTQRDERSCKICGPLNGVIVGLNDSFDAGFIPPAHPNCRCVLLYRT